MTGARPAGPAGARPVDDRHRRGGAWWIWLAALVLLLLVALLIVLLVRHFSGSDTTTAAKTPLPGSSAPAPAGTPTTSTPPAAPSTTAPAAGPAPAGSPAVAAASCAHPTLVASPRTARPGQSVTVTGRHFSGCSATTGHAVPAVHLPVQVGLAGRNRVSRALAQARTSSTGYFRVTLVVPAGTTPGTNVALAATSMDSKTALTYLGISRVVYARAANPQTGTSATGAGGGTPTGVPAGSGGFAATTSSNDVDVELGLLVGGLMLAAGGTIALARRRQTGH